MVDAEMKDEEAAALQNLNNNILTSFMIIGINNYHRNDELIKKLQLPKEEIKS